jgi:Leucine-rich repeat (LRR) protein
MVSIFNFGCRQNPVVFADANLESIIRAAAGKPSGPLEPADLLKISSLNAQAANIANLSGLEYCQNLTELDLSWNRITDISTLTHLLRSKCCFARWISYASGLEF